MASVVDICNAALRNIRAGSINSLDEGSVASEYCRSTYPELRDQLLQSFNWSFAKCIRPLALLSDVDVLNWEFSYQYPNDCLRIQKLLVDRQNKNIGFRDRRDVYSNYERNTLRDDDFKIEFEVFTNTGDTIIGANQDELHIQYTKEITDPNQFSDLFRRTLSFYIASELAIPLTGTDRGANLAQYNYQMYEESLRQAKAKEISERGFITRDSEFVTVRR